MDNNNWRAAQGQISQSQGSAGEASAMPNAANAVAATAIDNGDWRTQLQADSRQRIVNKIMDTLKRHLPFSGQEGLQELKKIAVRFEEKIYAAATNQSDYLRKISLKMLTMETKSQNPMANPNAKNPSDPVGHMQSQIHNQPSMVNNQSQARQQLLAQNIQNTLTSGGAQNPANLTSTIPVSNLAQSNMPNVVGQNMPNISTVNQNQNPVGNSMGQGMSSNVFPNSQRQMHGRQQVAAQQQQQPTNPQLLYQQQLQHQYMKQKLQQGSMQQSLMQSQIQQQQQQNLLQPAQIQTSQQTVMQSTSLSNLQQNQQSSAQQGTQPVHSQSVMRQQQQQPQPPILHQQQTSMAQQQMLSAPQQQQQQQLIGQQHNTANITQSQLMGQSNSIPDLQQQQQQRLMGQQNNISNLQQQQLMGQQNNLSNMHQSQLAPQSSVSGLQQSQMLGTQSVNSGISANPHSVHMLQQKVSVQQQMQHNLVTNQGQQPQAQPMQQQIMSQMQSQNGQMQHLQQQSNPMQRDIQQRLQNSGALLQHQNVIEQQKQLFQSQRAIPEGSSTSLDSTAQTGNTSGGDWQEEVYQKIKTMKEMYLNDVNEMHSKIAAKLQQHDSLSQQTKNEQLDKLKMFKGMLERLIHFLRLSKNDIQISHKEKLSSVEKQIVNFLNPHRPRKPISLQQGQHPQPHMQQPQAQTQISQMQPQDNQINSQIQSMNVPSSVATMQQNNLSGLQHNSLSSVPAVSNSQQSMINSMQPASNSDGGQSNALNSLQQVAMNSLQQNPVSGSQSVNISPLTPQSGVNTGQSNLNNLQQSSTIVQNQHLKQQEQQMMQSHQLKQIQQRHIQHQYLQRQQLMQQQQQQQTKQQQQPSQLPGHHMSPLHQMTDSSDVKMRQQMGVKPGVFQHHSTGQRATFHHQQMKPGAPFSMSSPQVLQAASPQVPQHHSPQIDQNLLSSLTRSGTPLQSANSPFIMPPPSPPLAQSPMPGESEKVNSGISSLSNAGNIGHHQATAVSGPAQSLAIGTPGISASPLLAEFTCPDAAHGNASSVISSKLNAVEQPFERLIKAVKSVSCEALTASVSDISSVVSMVDRIAGSAPGNGSRAAVGEDLVAMTKCRLQARNFFTQDGPSATKKMRRSTTAMPSNIVPSSGSINESGKVLNGPDTSEMESTATSSIKRHRNESNDALLEEIHEINCRLIDTVVEICDEDVDPVAAVAAASEGGEGTIVKCSFSAVALSPDLKSQYASAQMSPIQPLRLLVPTNYPNCSPILLDKFPIEVSKEYEDLSIKAKSRFNISLRCLSQPMSLEEMAKTWDMCARAVISEYSQQSGGGTFSSKYGIWENCLTAS